VYLLFPGSTTTHHHHSQAQLDAGIDLVLPEAAQTKQTAGGFGISLILITLLLFLCIRRARRAAHLQAVKGVELSDDMAAALEAAADGDEAEENDEKHRSF